MKRHLLLALLLGLLAACGPAPAPDVAPTEAPQENTELAFVRSFYERIIAGEHQQALEDYTCLGREPGAEIGITEVQYMQTLFPWIGLTLVDVEPTASSEPAPGTTQTFYVLSFESDSGIRVTANLLVVNTGDGLCVDIENIFF